jgi:hypothetical protein
LNPIISLFSIAIPYSLPLFRLAQITPKMPLSPSRGTGRGEGQGEGGWGGWRHGCHDAHSKEKTAVYFSSSLKSDFMIGEQL